MFVALLICVSLIKNGNRQITMYSLVLNSSLFSFLQPLLINMLDNGLLLSTCSTVLVCLKVRITAKFI